MVSLYDPEPSNPKPLNGQQFSQGTLFTPPKPTAEHRWPLGYSPERKAQVAEAFSKTTISVSSKFHKGELFKATREFGYPGTAGERTRLQGVQRKQTRNAFIDTLARSTVPIEHLQNMPNPIKVAPMPGTQGGGLRTEKNPMTGEVSSSMKIDPYGYRSGSRPELEHAVLHEFGHHADVEANPRRFYQLHQEETFGGRLPAASLEAYAEGYAYKHRVPKRNDPDVPYSKLATYTQFHGVQGPLGERFRSRFHVTSGKSVEEAMAPAHMSQQFPEGEQKRLFNRVGVEDESKMVGNMPDYGQHSLHKKWDADPETNRWRKVSKISTKNKE